MTFRLKMLPALDGDCLLLSWGDDGPLHHMVVDGGRKGAYAYLHDELAAIKKAGEKLDLYVLSHVDADHIEGSLAYFDDVNRPLLPEQVWYNGFEEMGRAGVRSMRQGDDWSKAIARLRLPLNTPFEDGVAAIEKAPGPIDVEGLKVTMLSPDAAHLAAMRVRWEAYRKTIATARSGVRGGARAARPPVKPPIVVDDYVADGEIDTEIPNGTSIAFVAEWRDRRVLLAGDAHPDLLTSWLKPLAREEGGRYRLDFLKASHHGSKKNTSRELIESIDCRQIAISTNGSLHQHPDPESIARFIHYGVPGVKDVWFNYGSDWTLPWGDDDTKAKYGYRAHFPPADGQGIMEIDLMVNSAP
ncbi:MULTISPECIES: ComEC/Rec2 family competence protein [unclassified Sphingomonas]|uniref:ComEC/Rec2 family competence protein n=1 Tax=unclassified Sphingomonas TaxID=196159 RepID=UPI00215176A3|nr:MULTISPECIES: MBL fold metallo-hydrolase [unclassified Sphingomonas]MCR5870351.1 hypothetical protein [Sphingomonas sp. J344]UUY01314.1 hypothetical protein LRS08_09945 [Sphingomonas sp. J315]